MKVTEYIAQADKTLVSFEILPPQKGQSIKELYKMLDPLMEFSPPFINVTYHRSEYIFKRNADATFIKVPVRKRPGTVGICSAIRYRYKVDTVPHLICGGFTKDATEDALIDLHYLGINNVLALRGDPMKSENEFIPTTGGHSYASELVQQIAYMNKGVFLDENLRSTFKTDFCIGVAGYPEKHFEAPNMKTDLRNLKAKIDAGAHYIMTQMFYDNQKFFAFVQQCREEGITVPIIPGLKPITSIRQLSSIPRFFKIDIPADLADAMEKCKDDAEAVVEVGKEWCIAQSKELVAAGVPCVHFYTMGRVDTFVDIARAVF
ncbi:MAG: methylenetetrahydrofolate reductase [NAD(P)H] [Chitinophagales bacterium]|nr:methylenetetrahydrofolate reductase [NAD(P)H] [Bacteroidota bacterium]MCB9042240.1 methylenetetrahydrofolate reductase [NAD(P)H] [Chitinophagales bacterium]